MRITSSRKSRIRSKIIMVLALLVFQMLTFSTAVFAEQVGNSNVVRFAGGIKVEEDQIVENAIAFGGPVKVEGIAGNVVAFGGAASVKGTARGNVVAFGGPVATTGNIRGNLVAFGGGASVDGIVGENLVVFGGDIFLGENTVINGDIVSFGGIINMHPEAIVKGSFIEQPWEVDFMGRPALVDHLSSQDFSSIHLWFKVLGALLMVIIGWTIGMLVPQNIDYMTGVIKVDGLKSFGIGLLIKFLTIPIAVALLITIIGIPLIPVFLIGLWLAQLTGLAAFGLLLGRAIADKLGNKAVSFSLSLAAGLVIIALVRQVPYAGSIILFIIKTIALGAVLSSKFGTGNPWFGAKEKPVI